MHSVEVRVYENLLSAAREAEKSKSKSNSAYWMPSLEGSDSYLAGLQETCAVDIKIPGNRRDVSLNNLVENRYRFAISELIQFNIEQAHLLVAHRHRISRIRSYKGLFYNIAEIDKGRHVEIELNVDHYESIQAGALKISLHNLNVCLDISYNGRLLLFGDTDTIISKEFIQKTVEEDPHYPDVYFKTYKSITKIVCDYQYPIVTRIGDFIDFTGFRVFAPTSRRSMFSEQIYRIRDSMFN